MIKPLMLMSADFIYSIASVKLSGTGFKISAQSLNRAMQSFKRPPGRMRALTQLPAPLPGTGSIEIQLSISRLQRSILPVHRTPA
jgi:hypothetical protein